MVQLITFDTSHKMPIAFCDTSKTEWIRFKNFQTDKLHTKICKVFTKTQYAHAMTRVIDICTKQFAIIVLVGRIIIKTIGSYKSNSNTLLWSHIPYTLIVHAISIGDIIDSSLT